MAERLEHAIPDGAGVDGAAAMQPEPPVDPVSDPALRVAGAVPPGVPAALVGFVERLVAPENLFRLDPAGTLHPVVPASPAGTWVIRDLKGVARPCTAETLREFEGCRFGWSDGARRAAWGAGWVDGTRDPLAGGARVGGFAGGAGAWGAGALRAWLGDNLAAKADFLNSVDNNFTDYAPGKAYIPPFRRFGGARRALLLGVPRIRRTARRGDLEQRVAARVAKELYLAHWGAHRAPIQDADGMAGFLERHTEVRVYGVEWRWGKRVAVVAAYATPFERRDPADMRPRELTRAEIEAVKAACLQETRAALGGADVVVAVGTYRFADGVRGSRVEGGEVWESLWERFCPASGEAWSKAASGPAAVVDRGGKVLWDDPFRWSGVDTVKIAEFFQPVRDFLELLRPESAGARKARIRTFVDFLFQNPEMRGAVLKRGYVLLGDLKARLGYRRSVARKTLEELEEDRVCRLAWSDRAGDTEVKEPQGRRSRGDALRSAAAYLRKHGALKFLANTIFILVTAGSSVVSLLLHSVVSAATAGVAMASIGVALKVWDWYKKNDRRD